jgi:cytochrome P450 family 114
MTHGQWKLPVDVLEEISRPATLADPYPFLAWVRDHDPVHVTPTGIYLVTRYADGREVLQNLELFRNPERDEIFRLFPTARRHRSQLLLLNTVTLHNPPAHTRLRRLVSRDFTAQRVDDLCGRIAEISDGLVDAVVEPYRDGEEVDLHSAVAAQLPVHVFGELLGVPEQDRLELSTLMPMVLAAMHPGATEEHLNQADEVNRKIESYFTELAEERRRHPRNDLISACVALREDDSDIFSTDEFMSMLWGLWAGGFATTATAIDHGVLTMLRHPEETHWLRGGLGRARSFVDELLRYEAPATITAISRFAVRDVLLSGRTIPTGADVRMVFPACNRDPAAFEAPDRFDPARPALHRTHLSFGHGLHYCLGAALSRMELSVVLPKLHSRLPDLALAGQPAYGSAFPIRAVDRLPVALAAA